MFSPIAFALQRIKSCNLLAVPGEKPSMWNPDRLFPGVLLVFFEDKSSYVFFEDKSPPDGGTSDLELPPSSIQANFSVRQCQCIGGGISLELSMLSYKSKMALVDTSFSVRSKIRQESWSWVEMFWVMTNLILLRLDGKGLFHVQIKDIIAMTFRCPARFSLRRNY